ncbi:ABC-2 type transporter domain-containing protein [Ditylenchus destructor]|nr:ABC-2 type transporter domain-containing protein [Ditylenchus destructor]
MLLKVRLFQTIFIAVLLGVIYFNTQIKQTTTFCEELPIFMREHTAHLYRVDTFFIAKNLAELCQYLLYPVVFSTIVYWMSDFGAYALFSLSCVLICNVAVSLAYAGACIFGTIEVATTILPIVDSLPIYFYPLKYLSYFGYAYESAAINQWTRVNYIPGCDEPLNHTMNSTSTCSHNGQDVLESLSFHPSKLVFDYAAMFAMIVVLRIIAFISLWVRAVTKR